MSTACGHSASRWAGYSRGLLPLQCAMMLCGTMSICVWFG